MGKLIYFSLVAQKLTNIVTILVDEMGGNNASS